MPGTPRDTIVCGEAHHTPHRTNYFFNCPRGPGREPRGANDGGSCLFLFMRGTTAVRAFRGGLVPSRLVGYLGLYTRLWGRGDGRQGSAQVEKPDTSLFWPSREFRETLQLMLCCGRFVPIPALLPVVKTAVPTGDTTVLSRLEGTHGDGPLLFHISGPSCAFSVELSDESGIRLRQNLLGIQNGCVSEAT
ncbi:hypothetical protein VUR80DRAFT_6305 [Thermomyces stellatus]